MVQRVVTLETGICESRNRTNTLENIVESDKNSQADDEYLAHRTANEEAGSFVSHVRHVEHDID